MPTAFQVIVFLTLWNGYVIYNQNFARLKFHHAQQPWHYRRKNNSSQQVPGPEEVDYRKLWLLSAHYLSSMYFLF